MDQRSARLAANEAVFRAGNERIDALLADRHGTTPYMCECGDAHCFQMIDLTNDEYEAVRSHPARFAVASGHEDLTAGEVVVSESSSPNWQLTVDGSHAARTRAYGWANAYAVDTGGSARLRFRTPLVHLGMLVAQLALWLFVVRELIRTRRRRAHLSVTPPAEGGES